VGVLVLLALAVALIWRGEPQPSSRPSGTSVAVSGTASAAGALPPLLVLRGGRLVVFSQNRVVRTVSLPDGVVPRSVLTNRGLTVVLAVLDGKQRAYAVTAGYAVRDLGYADAVLPAVRDGAAVLIETALIDPGTVQPGDDLTSAPPTPTGRPSLPKGSSGSASASGTASSTGKPVEKPLGDYSVRRYDPAGRPTEPSDRLPRGYRAAVDTSVGLVVWQPVNRVFDQGVEHESLSAAALLVRPNATIRPLGPVHPLATDGSNLLVWDVKLRRFGMMPLQYVGSTATSTASTSASPGQRSTASASALPTAVAGTRWFQPTRGMLLVTGPATFSPAGTAFAVYAQVGSRRRLVVARLADLGTDQVAVLVLRQPPAKTSAVVSPSGSGTLVLPSPTGSTGSPTPSVTPSGPGLAPDGYPVPAPLSPLWLAGQVVGVAQDGTVIGYHPGDALSAQLPLDVEGVRALAPAP